MSDATWELPGVTHWDGCGMSQCKPVITIRKDCIDGTVWSAWCATHSWDGPQRHNEAMARIDLDEHCNQKGENA